jgi:toxin ParE1/3/4
MTIFWTDFAKNRLSDIFDFYKNKVSLQFARKLVTSIIKHSKSIEKHPLKGPLEEHLIDRPHQFRYSVFKNYKLIYWVNTKKNRIEIVHVFDTRQNPLKIKNEI